MSPARFSERGETRGARLISAPPPATHRTPCAPHPPTTVYYAPHPRPPHPPCNALVAVYSDNFDLTAADLTAAKMLYTTRGVARTHRVNLRRLKGATQRQQLDSRR